MCNKERKYPALMESVYDGAIVLFVAEREGVQIKHGTQEEDRFVHFDDCWDMRKFRPYHGTIALSNE